jgi:Ca-activated chloride channel family protein
MTLNALVATLLAFTTWQFSTSVDLVEVYATVTDEKGRLVDGLTKDDFVVYEEGVPQEVTAFAAGEVPLSVALALDRSFSMQGERLRTAKSAAHVFVGQLRPDDQAMLIGFGSVVETVVPLGRDRVALHEAIRGLTTFGSTALHDAVITAIDEVQRGQGRRALVVLSDADDRDSKATAAQVVATARASDVIIYPVAFGNRPSPLFDDIAAVTGGRSFRVPRLARLATVFQEVARELRHHYLLGYVPARTGAQGDARYRTIRVEVRRPGTTVRARAGYVGR